MQHFKRFSPFYDEMSPSSVEKHERYSASLCGMFNFLFTNNFQTNVLKDGAKPFNEIFRRSIKIIAHFEA